VFRALRRSGRCSDLHGSVIILRLVAVALSTGSASRAQPMEEHRMICEALLLHTGVSIDIFFTAKSPASLNYKHLRQTSEGFAFLRRVVACRSPDRVGTHIKYSPSIHCTQVSAQISHTRFRRGYIAFHNTGLCWLHNHTAGIAAYTKRR
jgi:hypothetical protein